MYLYFAIRIFLITFLTLALNSCGTGRGKSRLIEGLERFPPGLDPARNFVIEATRIYSHIYETLLKLDSDYKTLIPNLAYRWEVSKNKRQYKFFIRSNVFFHDGSKLTAEAIKFSFDRQIQENQNSPLFDNIERVEVEDSLTLIINLKIPSSIFPYSLASPRGLVAISKSALQNYGDDISLHPVGTGAYYLSKWENNKLVELTAFDSHWNSSNTINTITFQYFRDFYELQKALAENNTDILFAIPGHSIDRLRWQGTVQYKVLQPDNTIYLGMNTTNFPLNNRFLRRAILKSINLPDLVFNVNRGNATIAQTPLPPYIFNQVWLRQAGYDIHDAIMQLENSGLKDTLHLKFFYPKEAFLRQTMLELIKSQLRKSNILLDIKALETWEEHNNACRSDSSQLFISAWVDDVLGDPYYFLYSLFHSQSEYNMLHFKNNRIDNWLETARSESNEEIRQELYMKIVEVILEETPAVFLFHVKPIFAYNKNKIKTLPVNPYGIIQYQDIILNN